MIRNPERHFRKLALPTWEETMEHAELNLTMERNRKKDGRRRQFNVNIADRAQLDALAHTLDMPRSKVINLALKELAAEMEVHDDHYTDLFIESCKRIATWLENEYDCSRKEAVQAAGALGRDKLMSRTEWLDILRKKRLPRIAGGYISSMDIAEGKQIRRGHSFQSKKEYIRYLFERRVEAILNGRFTNQMWRYIGRNR